MEKLKLNLFSIIALSGITLVIWIFSTWQSYFGLSFTGISVNFLLLVISIAMGMGLRARMKRDKKHPATLTGLALGLSTLIINQMIAYSCTNWILKIPEDLYWQGILVVMVGVVTMCITNYTIVKGIKGTVRKHNENNS